MFTLDLKMRSRRSEMNLENEKKFSLSDENDKICAVLVEILPFVWHLSSKVYHPWTWIARVRPYSVQILSLSLLSGIVLNNQIKNDTTLNFLFFLITLTFLYEVLHFFDDMHNFMLFWCIFLNKNGKIEEICKNMRQKARTIM